MAEQVVKATPSFKTVMYSWLTKMIFQWVVLCIPLLFVFHSICPELTPEFAAKLLMHSILIALGMSLLMTKSKLVLDEEGVTFENKLLFQKTFIPWKEISFGKPFPIAWEKHFVIINQKDVKRTIKIWPSMNNYELIKKIFEDHKILLEKGQLLTPKANFRSFDDVINESFK